MLARCAEAANKDLAALDHVEFGAMVGLVDTYMLATDGCKDGGSADGVMGVEFDIENLWLATLAGQTGGAGYGWS